MKKRQVFFALAVAAGLCVSQQTEAARLDAYRAMMEGRSFTLRYEQPQTQMEALESEGYLHEGELLPIVQLHETQTEPKQNPSRGVVVASGEDRYAEAIWTYGKRALAYTQGKEIKYFVVDESESGEHFLKKGGNRFYYFSSFAPEQTLFGKGKSKWSYQGSMGKYGPSAKIKANVCMRGAEKALRMEADDCNATVGQFLAALCPNEAQMAYYAPPVYDAAGEGKMEDGRFYEDYAAERDGRRYAMRCYFDEDTLVQVSLASYQMTTEGAVDETSRSAQILYIKAFSSEPDMSYLSLPKELQDVT